LFKAKLDPVSQLYFKEGRRKKKPELKAAGFSSDCEQLFAERFPVRRRRQHQRAL
jgi:hypothetical protein